MNHVSHLKVLLQPVLICRCAADHCVQLRGSDTFFFVLFVDIDSKGWIFCKLLAPFGVWPGTTQSHGHAKTSCSSDEKHRPTERSKTLRTVIIGINRAAAPPRCCTVCDDALWRDWVRRWGKHRCCLISSGILRYVSHILQKLILTQLFNRFTYGLLWKPKVKLPCLEGRASGLLSEPE